MEELSADVKLVALMADKLKTNVHERAAVRAQESLEDLLSESDEHLVRVYPLKGWAIQRRCQDDITERLPFCPF
eukprot:9475721-Pyramimonas_sp.AAC.1